MYRLHGKRARGVKFWAITAAVILVVAGGTAAVVQRWYNDSLGPVSASHDANYFTVESGESVAQIADKLKHAGLIRSAGAFETYVRAKRKSLKAGTYILNPSMGTRQIADKMASGDVAKNLLTILPAKRLDQIKQAFRKAGYSTAQIDAAFNPDQYRSLPALASLPAGASLEGYLYPDSFQKTTSTPVSTIISESLDEMNKHLTPDIVRGFASQHLTVYQGITLASIVEQETGDPTAQSKVAQVFLRRLADGMRLQSNVTANYGAVIDGIYLPSDVNQAEAIAVRHDSAYNTYLHDGLPPGPISNLTASALKAVAHPASGDYLYFVVGGDCQIHFSRTRAEHEAAIQKYGLGCKQ